MGRRKQHKSSKYTIENHKDKEIHGTNGHPLQASFEAIFEKCYIKEQDAIESCGINEHPLQLYLDALFEKRTKKDKEAKKTHSNSGQSLQIYLDALFENRRATREKALVGLLDAFTRNFQLEFAEDNYVTLQHQLLHLIVRGASTEVSDACHALGLLAITIGHGKEAYEIMEESVPKLSQALNSYSHSDSLKRISVMECLAVLTFVGATCDEETYRSMEIIWQFIHSVSGYNVTPGDKAVELASAISSWSFLLTTVVQLKIHSSDWQESISLLSNLLDKEDYDLHIVVGDSIGLVFDLGGLKEFYYETKNHTNSNQLIEENKRFEGFACLDRLKTQILNLMRKQSFESISNVSTKKLFKDVLAFLETGDYPKTSIKVCNEVAVLEITSWGQHIQLKFLRHLLGSSGFTKHMQKNEFLLDVLTVGHKKQRSPGNTIYTLDNCKDTDLCYLPHLKKSGDKHLQRLYKSPNSVLGKARTQMLRKERSVAQARNNGHYAMSEQDF